MQDVQKALLINEIHLAQGNRPCAQIISSTASRELHVAAIKLNQTVVFAELGGFRAQPSFNTPHGTQRTGVSGVSFSPDGTYIAAFSSDELYVARVYPQQRAGQLKHIAQLASIKSVHWCPHSTALAVCCKQQVDIYLVVLPPPGRPSYDGSSSTTPPAAAAAVPQASQQQSAITLAPLQRLPGPRSASAGAKCACWLPRGAAGSPAALLAAWSADLLVFTWQPNAQGVDWSRHKVHRFLAGWPGPIRAITAAPNPSSSSSSSSDSCLVLGTVDAQLALERSSSSNSSMVGSQIDAELAQLRVAAAAAGGSSSTNSNTLGLQPQRQGSGSSGRMLITELQPDAAPGVGQFLSGAPLSPAAAAAAAAAGGAAAADPAIAPVAVASPYPDVVVSKTPRVPSGHEAAALNRSGSGSSSVLSSLLNIQGGAAAAGASSSSGEPACICMLELNLSEFVQTGGNASDSAGGSKSDGGSSPSQQSISNVRGLLNKLSASLSGSFSSLPNHPANPEAAGPAAAKPASPSMSAGSAGSTSTGVPFSSMLQLPHLPLPDLLAVQDGIAAIGSSRGPPMVTLCSFKSQQGLQLLQVVALPLPSPAAGCGAVRVRLDGLLLTPAVQNTSAAGSGEQQHMATARTAAASARTHYPMISEGGWPGVVEAAEGEWCSANSSSNGSAGAASVPDIVVLLSCSQAAAPQPPGFASFGSSSSSMAVDKTADTYLLKCRAPQVPVQLAAQPVEQRVQYAVARETSTADVAAAAVAADAPAAAAVRSAAKDVTDNADGPEGSIWWRSLEQQAAQQKLQLKSQQHDPADDTLTSIGSKQQPQPAEQQLQRRAELRYPDHRPRDQRQQQQQQEVPGRYVRLERRPSQQRQEQQLQQHQQQQQQVRDLEHHKQQRELKHQSVVGLSARAASADTPCSTVSCSTVTTWTSLAEEPDHQQQQQQQGQASLSCSALPVHPSSPQQQEHQKRLEKEDAEFQAAVSRVNKVVAVLSGVQSRLETRLENSLECNTVPGQRLAAAELSAAAAAGGGGSSGPPTPDAAGSDAGAGAELAAGAATSSSSTSSANDIAVSTAAPIAAGSAEHSFAVQQAALLAQVRQEAQHVTTAATHEALNELQVSIELRLDALLRLQKQQQQLLEQQLRQNQQQQLLAGVLAGVQSSLERRFNTMEDLMQQMVRQLDRLATGLEDMEK